VTAEHLLDDVFLPVCSPRIANGRLPKRPEDLARYTLLRSEDEPWKPWFEVAGLDWPEPARGPMFSDSSHMMQAAAEGQGIALARSSLLAYDVRNGILVVPFDIVVAAPRNFWLVYPPRMANSTKLAVFRQWLHVEIRAHADVAAHDPRGKGSRAANREAKPCCRGPRRRP
jgi:LysR family glycine cleavage system transcriptional activator